MRRKFATFPLASLRQTQDAASPHVPSPKIKLPVSLVKSYFSFVISLTYQWRCIRRGLVVA
jgi:hypothetical protein